MRKILALLFLIPLPLFAAVGSWNGVAFTAWNGVAQTAWNGTTISCASGSGVAFSDDFNRVGPSLGANWTAFGPGTIIVANEANAPVTFDNTSKGAAYTGTSCGSADHYVKITITTDVSKAGALLRYTDASTECYGVRMDLLNDTFTWNHLTTPAGTDSQVASSTTLTLAPGDSLGVTITGTGNSTVLRVWINPSGVHVEGDPADNWNGDTSPDVTFTDDPADPVDSGNFVGLQGIWSGGDITWDNFFGGDVP